MSGVFSRWIFSKGSVEDGYSGCYSKDGELPSINSMKYINNREPLGGHRGHPTLPPQPKFRTAEAARRLAEALWEDDEDKQGKCCKLT